MNSFPQNCDDRLWELLADRALIGLSADQEHELEELLRAASGLQVEFQVNSLDQTVAMLDIAAVTGNAEGLPNHLAQRILSQHKVNLHSQPDGAGDLSQPDGAGDLSQPDGDGELSPVQRTVPRLRRREWVAWLTAAACLLLALFAWSQWPQSNRSVSPNENLPLAVDEVTTPTLPESSELLPVVAEPTIAQQREQLLASAPDVIRLQLISDGGPAAPESGGDIVWSSGRQMGYLHLHGLAGNPPTDHRQYQLWIVGSDISGNEITSGGMFHVDRSQLELILPIQAEHFINQPKMFVVSVEPSGGGAALAAPLLAKSDAVGP